MVASVADDCAHGARGSLEAARGLLRAREDLHDDHRRAAVPADEERSDTISVASWLGGDLGHDVQQLAHQREVGLRRTVGQQPVVADAMEAAGQHMQQEAAHELAGLQRHRLVARAALGAVVLPAEGDAALVDGDAGGCWRWPRGACSATGTPARPRARQTGAWRRRPTRTGAAARATRRRPLASASAACSPKNCNCPAAMRVGELFEEAAPEQAREHAHRQEEARPARDPALAVGRQPAAGHDAVHVRVVRQRRAPGVQHQRGADARAQVLRVGGDGRRVSAAMSNSSP